MATTNQRLTTLEAEVLDLKTRVTALENAAPAPSPTPTPVPSPTPVPTPTPTPTPTGATFFDDFTSGVDLTKWGKSEWPNGFSNSESDNMGDNWLQEVAVVNGQLRLRAERGTTPSGKPWRSAAMVTKGKFQQLYGTFTARMQYPYGQGAWPAFWLLQGDGASGARPELDVIEAYPFGSSVSPFPPGGGPTQYAMTNHWSGTGRLTTWCKPGINLTGAFHEFEIEWRAGLLIARCDGVEMGRQTSNVPAVPMFVILNNAMGSWAGNSDATTPNPYDLLVDWVRVLP